jgi:hypothetical protein
MVSFHGGARGFALRSAVVVLVSAVSLLWLFGRQEYTNGYSK